MSKQSFIKGTMILLAAGIINRLLGFVPRITLPRIIGAEGVGLYQLGYPFLIVIWTITTGGIPLAVAKLVAEAESKGDRKQVRKILLIAMTLTITVSLLFTGICIWTAPWITTHLLTDSRVYFTFLAMSPNILIVSISSVFRGYFQGKQNMIPTATSQVMETIVRIFAMLIFAYYMLPYGIEYAAAGAMVGVVIGELSGLAVLYVHYNQSKRTKLAGQHIANDTDSKKGRKYSTLRRLLRISIPVTSSRLVGSGSYFLESIMIIQSLAVAGVAATVATAQYGALQGMVMPILFLPSALTYSLAVSLVPSLSESAAKNDMRTIHKRLHQSLRLALVTGAPFAVIMFVLAEPVCYYLYHDTDVAVMLKMMAPAALFIYLQGPLQATLQALDKPGMALLNSFTGACIKLVLIYLLATKPNLGIIGAVIAICVNIVLVTVLHWNSVVKMLKFSMQISDFMKVGASMLVMGTLCWFIYTHAEIGSDFLKFMVALTAGVVTYLISIVMLKLVDRYDLARIPWFGKFIAK